MKSLVLILILFFCSEILFAQKENVKIYLNNGNQKSYNIEDIEELQFIKSGTGYTLKIYHSGSSTPSTYPTLSIDS
ncbi:hypothetical protein D9V86_00470, partial [Bacteroidetes/Chlorobi group bacterium ChocPot_Mid]